MLLFDYFLDVYKNIEAIVATPAIIVNIVMGRGLGNSASYGANIEAILAKKLQKPNVVEE